MRYLFTFIGLSILILSFFTQKLEIDSNLINSTIKDKNLPLQFEKTLTKTTINNLFIESKNNDLIGYVNIDFESPILKFKDKNTSVTFNYLLENNNIYVKIKNIDYQSLAIDDLYNESLNNTKDELKPLTKKLVNLMDKGLGSEVSKKVLNNLEKNLDKDKILEIIDSKLKEKEFKVYSLGLKGYFIKDIKLNHFENNTFSFNLVLSLGTFGIILGSFIILLSLMKDILLGLISFFE